MKAGECYLASLDIFFDYLLGDLGDLGELGGILLAFLLKRNKQQGLKPLALRQTPLVCAFGGVAQHGYSKKKDQ